MTKSGGEIAQGKAKDAGGLTPAKDDNAALRDCYSRTFAGNSDDCYNQIFSIGTASEPCALGAFFFESAFSKLFILNVQEKINLFHYIILIYRL